MPQPAKDRCADTPPQAPRLVPGYFALDVTMAPEEAEDVAAWLDAELAYVGECHGERLTG